MIQDVFADCLLFNCNFLSISFSFFFSLPLSGLVHNFSFMGGGADHGMQEHFRCGGGGGGLSHEIWLMGSKPWYLADRRAYPWSCLVEERVHNIWFEMPRDLKWTNWGSSILIHSTIWIWLFKVKVRKKKKKDGKGRKKTEKDGKRRKKTEKDGKRRKKTGRGVGGGPKDFSIL